MKDKPMRLRRYVGCGDDHIFDDDIFIKIDYVKDRHDIIKISTCDMVLIHSLDKMCKDYPDVYRFDGSAKDEYMIRNYTILRSCITFRKPTKRMINIMDRYLVSIGKKSGDEVRRVRKTKGADE